MIFLFYLINIILFIFIYLLYNKQKVWICDVINSNQYKSTTYLYYIPHRYCGIMNQIMDIAHVISLSLVLHKYFSCIIMYYYLVRFWKYIDDYFSFCIIHNKNKNNSRKEKNYTFTYKMRNNETFKLYSNLVKENDNNILIISHYSYFHLYKEKELDIFKKILVFRNENELKKKWIIYFDKYIIKTSNKIRRLIRNSLKGIENSFIIGMHIRTGYTDFGERVTYFGGYNNVNKFINESIRLCDKINKKCKWIVCTDNSNLYSNLTHNYSTYLYNYKKTLDYPQKLKHSIHYILKPFNKYSATVLYEIEILLNCDMLILSAHSRISNFIYNSKYECKYRNICKFIY